MAPLSSLIATKEWPPSPPPACRPLIRQHSRKLGLRLAALVALEVEPLAQIGNRVLHVGNAGREAISAGSLGCQLCDQVRLIDRISWLRVVSFSSIRQVRMVSLSVIASARRNLFRFPRRIDVKDPRQLGRIDQSFALGIDCVGKAATSHRSVDRRFCLAREAGSLSQFDLRHDCIPCARGCAAYHSQSSWFQAGDIGPGAAEYRRAPSGSPGRIGNNSGAQPLNPLMRLTAYAL